MKTRSPKAAKPNAALLAIARQLAELPREARRRNTRLDAAAVGELIAAALDAGAFAGPEWITLRSRAAIARPEIGIAAYFVTHYAELGRPRPLRDKWALFPESAARIVARLIALEARRVPANQPPTGNGAPVREALARDRARREQQARESSKEARTALSAWAHRMAAKAPAPGTAPELAPEGLATAACRSGPGEAENATLLPDGMDPIAAVIAYVTQGLTLREAAHRVGVNRTALYRNPKIQGVLAVLQSGRGEHASGSKFPERVDAFTDHEGPASEWGRDQ